MNTKILMIVNAIVMAVFGILCQLMPHEVLHFFNSDSSGIVPLLVQIIGAMYLGFAMMNWMAKSVLIGGIYARPLAMGNFLHFVIGALALVKFAFTTPDLWTIWIMAIVYSIFAIFFGIVIFTNPPSAKR